jgi:hypothetical protein
MFPEGIHVFSTRADGPTAGTTTSETIADRAFGKTAASGVSDPFRTRQGGAKRLSQVPEIARFLRRGQNGCGTPEARVLGPTSKSTTREQRGFKAASGPVSICADIRAGITHWGSSRGAQIGLSCGFARSVGSRRGSSPSEICNVGLVNASLLRRTDRAAASCGPIFSVDFSACWANSRRRPRFFCVSARTRARSRARRGIGALYQAHDL